MNALFAHAASDDTAILCRAFGAAPISTEQGEIVYLTAGLVEGVPSQSGKATPVQILVDAATASALEQQRAAIVARGDRPYFDFNHDDEGASFWPAKFFWRAGVGVIASGEFSRPGKEAIEGKVYRGFSPVCHTDDVRKRPARIVCNPRAHPNMGGFVNRQAFKSIPPFFAKDGHHSAGAPSGHQNQQHEYNSMTPEEIAALQAKNLELQKELDALKAKESALKSKNETDATIASELRAKEAEIKANSAALEVEALKAKAAKLEADAKTRAEADADAAVQAAVARGAIAAKDTETQTKWKALICADATAAGLLAAIPGAPALSGRITPSPSATSPQVQIGAISARDAVKAYGALMAKQRDASTLEEKVQIAREAAAIYAKDLRSNEGFGDMPIVGANALGTLAGTLISQRTLELLKFQFPMLNSITTDFSDQQALFGQVVTTRIITPPTVGTYSTTTGYAQTDVTATDVSITIDAHKHVQTVLNANNLASTARRLFEEFAPANAYAIAKELVDALYSLITAANFANVSTVALASFVRNSIIDIGVALTLRAVPEGAGNRTIELTPTYYGALSKDSSATLNVITALTAFQRPEILTEGVLPNLEGFRVINAANLPGNGENLTGFAHSKSALALATRLPQDYTQVLPGASFGNVSVVTNPDTGMSVMQVEYVDHKLGTANQRLAWMYGKAVGQSAAGQRIVSS